jgi:hypothetical protein
MVKKILMVEDEVKLMHVRLYLSRPVTVSPGGRWPRAGCLPD